MFGHQKPSEMPFEEDKPHTLAEFIALSIKQAIVPEGLPEDISAPQAAQRFGGMNKIMLKPLPFNQHYFFGWFELHGRQIMRDNGDLLFTLFGPKLDAGWQYTIRIEDAARKLLEQPES